MMLSEYIVVGLISFGLGAVFYMFATIVVEILGEDGDTH